MDVEELIEKGARLVCCPNGCKNDGKRFEDRAYWAKLPCNSIIHRDGARAVVAMMLDAVSEEAEHFNEILRSKALEDFTHRLDSLAEQVEKANG